MENNKDNVEFIVNKTYFIDETLHLSFKFNEKSLKPKFIDWIALYKCSSNRNLEEFVAVETDFIIRAPNKHGFYPVTFLSNQLKNLECNVDYEFLYGNKYNEISGISRPVCFIHKNDCFCRPKVSETNNCSNCVSQELVNSLLARISLIESQLSDYKFQSNEIISMNKQLITQIHECEAIVEKNNQFLDTLFFTDKPVTNDDYRWMQPCTSNDLKMNVISRQECELQDLSNQNAALQKMLEKSKKLFKNEEKDNQSSNIDSNTFIDSMVNVETGFVPEPSIATFVFIDSEEDDLDG